ncbi:MAG TPA: hypothetical protein PL009_09455 [Flavipsychrobacter sp.]|nr:hypothetical protein [Flavipsychrobacter sp.]
MLQAHKEAFFFVADKLNCWIGLREPNELSDWYIGKGGYTAKNTNCKAKTSDNAAHFFKGLVVNPVLCPGAFLPSSRETAIKKWKEFEQTMAPGFTYEKTGPMVGLVKWFGKSIHADFDLMYISKADAKGGLAFTTKQEQQKLFEEAKKMLNQKIGIDMILHGPEFLWDEGVGAREAEWVLSFGPKNAFRQDMSSMPQGAGAMH